MQAKPDCCAAPDLEIIRRLKGPPPPVEDVRQCRACGTFWRFDFETRMGFDGGDDYDWASYTRLTPAEAAALREQPTQ